jgi:hypothetical protein
MEWNGMEWNGFKSQEIVILLLDFILILFWFILKSFSSKGWAVAQLVEAQRYKPEGHGFDCLWGHWDFSLT